MKKINTPEKAKQMMLQTNIIIYGTIRDIEKHFFNSFSNIEILTHYFNSAYIIILENDSKDNTRNLLMKWYQLPKSNHIIKHILLLDQLDEKYPLRAHRLAYCRNIVLKYVFENRLNETYSYAFHCDLDDRFWSIDFDSIATCFQYDLEKWDMMSCVNKNNDYYDWWALRCEESWFNKNIFACEAEGTFEKTKEIQFLYQTKIGDFCNELIAKKKLIKIISAFNGFAVYKLFSLKNCFYSADYHCFQCNNQKNGCKEDNDHIGLHKQMITKGSRLFINTEMVVSYKPDNITTYNEYTLVMKKNIPELEKNSLSYILEQIITNDGLWLHFGIKNGEFINKISKKTEQTLFSFEDFSIDSYKKDSDFPNCSFQEYNEKIKPFLNKNVKVFIGNYMDSISSFKNNDLKNESISFLSIHSVHYQSTKKILSSLVNKIRNGSILFFSEFIHYPNYHLYEWKAFYEFVQEFHIEFEFIGANHRSSFKKSVPIKIIHNPLFYDSTTDFAFDWFFYISQYDDLKHIQSYEEAWNHWIRYGSKEGRSCQENNSIVHNLSFETLTSLNNKSVKENDFDWVFYTRQYNDLKHIQNYEEAWKHWIHYGSKEGRICKIIEKKTKEMEEKKIDEKEKEEKEEEEKENEKDAFLNFEWEYYIYKYEDLRHITTKEEAWQHWIDYGSKEGRSCDSFDWYLYIQMNPTLKKVGINTKEGVIKYLKKHNK
jgi:hypothetical protein